MRLGGFHRHSFIDYPGKISCVIFLSGCNFRCPYCHNAGLVREDASPPDYLDENWIYDYLEKRKGLLEGVVISGGEPTIQPGLFSFCETIKGLGYPVKLDTNGSRPEVAQSLIDKGLIDYVAMDIKTAPGNYSPSIVNGLNPDAILSSIRITMSSGLGYEFRTTCVKPFVDEEKVKTILKLIDGATLYVLQRFNPTEVLQPEFFQGAQCGYSDDEILHFQSIAAGYVQKCLIR